MLGRNRFATFSARAVRIALILLQSIKLLTLANRLLKRGLAARRGTTDHCHFLVVNRDVVSHMDAFLVKNVGLGLS